MKVRILTSRGGHPCGAVVDVADDVAAAWVGVGDAEPVQTSAHDEVPAPASPGALPIETAAAAGDGFETGMKKKAKGR